MLNTEVNFSLEDIQDDGHAISMVNYDPSLGQFVINQEAFEVIRQLPNPLGVISVAGMYRTGIKSQWRIFSRTFDKPLYKRTLDVE